MFVKNPLNYFFQIYLFHFEIIVKPLLKQLFQQLNHIERAHWIYSSCKQMYNYPPTQVLHPSLRAVLEVWPAELKKLQDTFYNQNFDTDEQGDMQPVQMDHFSFKPGFFSANWERLLSSLLLNWIEEKTMLFVAVCKEVGTIVEFNVPSPKNRWKSKRSTTKSSRMWVP